MILNNPVVLTPPSITKADGSKIEFPSITISELDYILHDEPKVKAAWVNIRPLLKPLVLWKDAAYDNIGNYTQEQIESRIIELLGNNPQDILQSLFK